MKARIALLGGMGYPATETPWGMPKFKGRLEAIGCEVLLVNWSHRQEVYAFMPAAGILRARLRATSISPRVDCLCWRFASRSNAGSDSGREPSVDCALPITNKAGCYFDCWRTFASGFDPLKGLGPEFSLLAKFPPCDERVTVVHLVVHSRNIPFFAAHAIQGAIRVLCCFRNVFDLSLTRNPTESRGRSKTARVQKCEWGYSAK
jgi:hypothetical protein